MLHEPIHRCVIARNAVTKQSSALDCALLDGFAALSMNRLAAESHENANCHSREGGNPDGINWIPAFAVYSKPLVYIRSG